MRGAQVDTDKSLAELGTKTEHTGTDWTEPQSAVEFGRIVPLHPGHPLHTRFTKRVIASVLKR